MIDLSVLVTESRNKETMGLDQMTPLEIVTVMNREDGKMCIRDSIGSGRRQGYLPDGMEDCQAQCGGLCSGFI